MDEYQMTGILGQAMASPTGEAIRRYLERKKTAEEGLLYDDGQQKKGIDFHVGRISMIRELINGLDRMASTNLILEKEQAP